MSHNPEVWGKIRRDLWGFHLQNVPGSEEGFPGDSRRQRGGKGWRRRGGGEGVAFALLLAERLATPSGASVGTTCHSKLDAAVEVPAVESKVGSPSPAAEQVGHLLRPCSGLSLGFTDSPVLSAHPQPSLARSPPSAEWRLWDRA